MWKWLIAANCVLTRVMVLNTVCMSELPREKKKIKYRNPASAPEILTWDEPPKSASLRTPQVIPIESRIVKQCFYAN